ncbi:MAG: hypothetical protein WC052_03555 [Patescibacteria group bacterium]
MKWFTHAIVRTTAPHKLIGALYRTILRPVLFKFDASRVHRGAVAVGEYLENRRAIVQFFCGRTVRKPKTVLGISFANPVGLAAGFDYNGHLAKVLPAVGFGFTTVGTVTARPSSGNPGKQLVRLPKSQAILVNKGFKSDGAIAVAARLDKKQLEKQTLGISIGSSNVSAVNTVPKAIDDYLETFSLFQAKPYVSFFELNVSCPNTALTETFSEPENFIALVRAVTTLGIRQPLFVKMPSEITVPNAEVLVRIALQYGIRGFIFSNLVKNRHSAAFDAVEIAALAGQPGNFSGRPTALQSHALVAHMRQVFGSEVALVSCGGIFSSADAQARFASGADLVQLITGMIYEGPQLINEIVEKIDGGLPNVQGRCLEVG